MIKIDGFEIDAALTEEHGHEAEVTEFPIEGQSLTTDHVRIKEITYHMTGVVSDTPIGPIADLRVDPNRVPTEVGRDVLESIFEAKDRITIQSSRKLYTDMVMQTLTFTANGQSGGSLPFTATFKRVNVQNNKRVQVRAVPASTTNLGNKATKPAGWIGTDALGRDVFVVRDENGAPSRYVRSDGTAASPTEAAEAVKRQGFVLFKQDKRGNTLLDNAAPNVAKPFWAPSSPTRP